MSYIKDKRSSIFIHFLSVCFPSNKFTFPTHPPFLLHLPFSYINTIFPLIFPRNYRWSLMAGMLPNCSQATQWLRPWLMRLLQSEQGWIAKITLVLKHPQILKLNSSDTAAKSSTFTPFCCKIKRVPKCHWIIDEELEEKIKKGVAVEG